MAKAKSEPKVILDRTYIIPLRKEWLKVPEYKRTNKAIKAIKQFLVKHMKVYDRDLKKIKIDIILNNEIRFRGIKKPPARIKVRARKYDDEIVRVELVDVPKIIQYKLDREKKKREKDVKKKAEKKKPEKKKPIEEKEKEETGEEKEETGEEKEETGEEKKEKEEKKEAVKEAGLKQAEQAAKQAKHTEVSKQPKIQRKALSR